MIAMPLAVVEERAQQLASIIREADHRHQLQVQVRQSSSQVGGGALPNQNLPTYVVAVTSPKMSTYAIEAGLRRNNPPLIGRIESDQYLMDVRTLRAEEFPTIQRAFHRLLQEPAATKE